MGPQKEGIFRYSRNRLNIIFDFDTSTIFWGEFYTFFKFGKNVTQDALLG